MVWFCFFFFQLGLMADGEEYDPNAHVPLWVNIVIHIISIVIFVYIFISEPMFCYFFSSI